MVIFLKVIQVILALSILVLVHEFGHFFFARMFKIKVEKFYLFFDAGFALFKFKPKKSDTEYGIGWLPFGGYCKIAGMVDESLNEEQKQQLKQEPKPYEFRAHPAWQRFFVLFGGVLFNVILAIIIYTGILYSNGEEYVKLSDIKTGVVVNDLGRDLGFMNGDIILSLDGKPAQTLNELRINLITDKAKTAQIIRDGEEMTIDIDEEYFPAILNSADLFDYGIPFVVDSIPGESMNFESGLQKGDLVRGVYITAHQGDTAEIKEFVQTRFFTEVKDVLAAHKGEKVELAVIRKQETPSENEDGSIIIPVQIDTAGLLGIYMDANLEHFYPITKKEFTLLSAIPAGFKKTGDQISSYWKQLKLIVSPKTKAYKSVGSFIAIGSIFPSSWNWLAFWSITAFLSIMLAVVNILPIPALDGGHILFTLYEIITGRKVNEKVLIVAQYIGLVLLIALMAYALGNDLFRFL